MFVLQEFLGNYDGETVHTNYFDKPIHARYLRIYPTQWHNSVALRLEVLGCYQPYRKYFGLFNTLNSLNCE